MYAAAGGASLASRQARQRQRQQKRNQQLQAKLHPPKAASPLSAIEHGVSTPTRQSRQFHQLPTNYLRAPQTQVRKLSGSYTTQSKLLLPIDEGDTQSMLQMREQHSHTQVMNAHSRMHSHSHAHPHLHQHYQYQHQHHFGASYNHGRVSPKLVHRHSGSGGASFQLQSPLFKSATATLPLVSQMEATPPMTPLGTTVVAEGRENSLLTIISARDQKNIAVPAHHDAIVVTPATPMASLGDVTKHQSDELTDAAAENEPLTASSVHADDKQPIQPPKDSFERKCSVYRMRRSDAFDEHVKQEAISSSVRSGVGRQLTDMQCNQQLQQQYEPLLTDESQLVFKDLPNGHKWQMCAYCEEGICVCEHTEVNTNCTQS